jgi:hypothetical protein
VRLDEVVDEVALNDVHDQFRERIVIPDHRLEAVEGEETPLLLAEAKATCAVVAVYEVLLFHIGCLELQLDGGLEEIGLLVLLQEHLSVEHDAARNVQDDLLILALHHNLSILCDGGTKVLLAGSTGRC